MLPLSNYRHITYCLFLILESKEPPHDTKPLSFSYPLTILFTDKVA